MTRYYFNGLTEEVKKESVETHALKSFEFDQIEHGGSGSEWDDSDNSSLIGIASVEEVDLSPFSFIFFRLNATER